MQALPCDLMASLSSWIPVFCCITIYITILLVPVMLASDLRPLQPGFGG